MYVLLPNEKKGNASTLGRRTGMYIRTFQPGWKCSLSSLCWTVPYAYTVWRLKVSSCSSVPHNVKTSQLISMQLTSTTGSGTDCSAGPAECGWMLPG